MVDLTELEACTLALIWRRQPCSAYVVQREFAKSLTPEWSGSTGAIYPAINRLVERGLVAAENRRWGERSKKILCVTDAGVKAVAGWVGELGRVAGDTTPDPVRTRMFFVDAITDPRLRRELMAQAIAAAEARLSSVRELARQVGTTDPVDAMAIAGLEAALEARIAWLRRISPEVKQL